MSTINDLGPSSFGFGNLSFGGTDFSSIAKSEVGKAPSQPPVQASVPQSLQTSAPAGSIPPFVQGETNRFAEFKAFVRS